MNNLQKFLYAVTGSAFIASQNLAHSEDYDPTNLSIEQLMETKVTSVTKSEQRFSDTAAAAYVISPEDIKRSGVTNIPDVLRMVPGVQVARIGASQWAVTARGFNGRFANKLLVLIDGRAVYTPTFGGVRWENQDLILEDIERIEVIRGPGASVWGQNAVNGVINIITKHAEDTRQGLMTVTSGNEENAIVQLRYGEQFGDNLHYRVFGKFLHRDGLVDQRENANNDDWTQGRGGFRVDWHSGEGDQVLLEGNGFLGETTKGFLFPTDNSQGPARHNREQNSGGHVLARWEHDFSVASTTRTQFYYENFNEHDPGFGSERRHTFDLEFQHDLAIERDNYFNWGLGYRLVSDQVLNGLYTTVDPNHKNLHLISAFVQDKAVFFDDRLELTFGSKFQYYTLIGWDYQPSARLLWKIHPEHRLWFAFSRAVRAPSRGETALNLRPLSVPGPLPFHFRFRGNPNLGEERVLSYEAGYRTWLGNRLSFDLALFYNDYDQLITGLTEPVDLTNRLISVTFKNGAKAHVWGMEMAAEWRPTEPVRLQLSYSLLQIDYENFNFSSDKRPRTDPAHQVSFRGAFDITPEVNFDVWVRYVDSIEAVNTLFSPARKVNSYIALDLQLAWKPMSDLELSVVGQNLNNANHTEYIEEVFAYPKQLERSVYGKISWRF